MSTQLSGGLVELVIGFEDGGYGVAPTTGYKISFAPTTSANTNQAINESSVINGDPSPSQPFLGFKDGSASLTVPIDDKAMGYLLKGLMGTPTTTVDSPVAGLNTHTFKRGTTIPSISIEINHTDAVGGLFYLTKGIGLNELSFSLGGDGELLATINGIGKETIKTTSTQFTTIINDVSDGELFGQFQGAITGTTAKFRTFDLKFNNNINPDTYVIDGSATRSCVVPGKFSINGSFTTLFEDDTLYAEARDFTTKQLTATLTNSEAGTALRSLVFDIEEAKLNAISNSEISTPNGMESSFDYQGFFNSGANGSAFQVTLVNDIVSYA